jgi:hypothetical protein
MTTVTMKPGVGGDQMVYEGTHIGVSCAAPNVSGRRRHHRPSDQNTNLEESPKIDIVKRDPSRNSTFSMSTGLGIISAPGTAGASFTASYLNSWIRH